MHDAVLDYVADAADRYELAGAILDIGGRDVNGTPRHLFPNATRYVVVDAEPAPNVDVVADAATLDLGELFDVVVSTEVFEHAEHAEAMVTAAFRHLAPGGTFVATMAGPYRHPHSAHGGPTPLPGEFYRNVSAALLEAWLAAAGFATWTIDDTGLDMRCTAFKAR